jgi:hypothetical protein
MRAVVVASLVMAAATAQAAPWSVELPAGYTEQPGGADALTAALSKRPRTVTADAQLYLSPDGRVRLTRVTWLTRFAIAPTRNGLLNLERGVMEGAKKQATTHVSDSFEWHGEQLVADQVDDVAGIRIHQRRLYSADTSRVVHALLVVCAGPADQLADCEKAQQTMELTLPDAASLTAAPAEDKKSNVAYLIGQITGGVLVLVLAIWYVMRRRTRT